MGLLNTLRFIINHPLNKNNKIIALQRWLKWQIGSRLAQGAIAVNFVNEAKLLVEPGMTGATGNVYTGLHEFEDMSFVLHMLRREDLFIDVGANIGAYSVLAAGVVGAQCISLEPIPETFHKLMQNIKLNGLSGIVDARNIGVGREEGILRFTTTLDTMNHVYSETDSNSFDTIDIITSTLDIIAGDVHPQLIKIDTEGFEGQVVAGAETVLTDDALAAVIVEVNERINLYGPNDLSLHKKMLDYGFSAFTYAPFERTLISLDRVKRESGNIIYIRDIDRVNERLKTAVPFSVNTFRI